MCSYLRLEYVETSRHFGDQMRVTVFTNAKGEKEREKEKGETAEKVNKQSLAIVMLTIHEVTSRIESSQKRSAVESSRVEESTPK